jgi:uncharacterized NAD(P)/FAD-binding protein YdhS
MTVTAGSNGICFDVAVIGNGTSAVALLASLETVFCATTKRRLRIAVIGCADNFGRGGSYPSDAKCLIMNTPACDLSIFGNDPNHFVDWLDVTHAEGDGRNFVQRGIFGDYLFETGRALLTRGGHCLVEGWATRIEYMGSHIAITGRDGLNVSARIVVLATGVPNPGLVPGVPPGGEYFETPFPTVRLLNSIRRDADVLILGSSLSAIDAAIALHEGGHRGMLYLASRSGRLPSVRAPRPDCLLSHTRREALLVRTRTADGGLGLRDILRFVRRDLHAAGLNWRDLFRSSEPDTLESFRARRAEAEGEIRWLTTVNLLQGELDTIWARLRPDQLSLLVCRFVPDLLHKLAAIPMANACRLEAMLSAGTLAVSGGLRGVVVLDRRYHAVLASGATITADCLVNATGMPRRLRGELYESLYEQGLAKEQEGGGLDACPLTGRVRTLDGCLNDRLYALGHPTCGVHPIINNVTTIVARSRELTAFIFASRSRLFG